MRAAQLAKVTALPALLAHQHKTLGMQGFYITFLSVWSFSGQVFIAATLLVAFFLLM